MQLDIGVDPKDESDGVMMMNLASVSAANRFIRQNSYGQENGVDHRIQLKKIEVDCGGVSSENVIAVQIEFFEPFYGVIYSKGRHDDPNCQ